MLCYVVFWIPTIQDTLFSFQQKQYNSDSINNITEIFNRRFSEEKKKKKRSNQVHVEHDRHNDSFDWASSGLLVTHFYQFFVYFHFNNAKRSYKLQTAHWDLPPKEKKKTTHLAYVHKYTLLNCEQNAPVWIIKTTE